MKGKKQKKIYIVFSIFVAACILLFSLRSYSESLRKDGQKELYETKNRKVAIDKFRSAQVFWPLLKLDKPYQNLLEQLSAIEHESAINIFLKEGASKQDINVLVSELQTIDGVKQVKFISNEEALKTYKEANKNNPLLLELVTPNLLPQSIKVYLDDFTVRNQVEQTAKNKPFVAKVIQVL